MQPRITRHGVVDSTSERAFAEIADGRARDFDVHVADGQSAGRGRLGRSWKSAPGEGLYLSVVLMPPAPAWAPPALTMALGLAVLDGLRGLGFGQARLDWPNDVVVDGAKLAGILVETRDLDPRRPAFVAGIGINVLQRGFDPELERERAVTSLALQGCAASVEHVLQAVLAALPARLQAARVDPQAVERDYARAAGLCDGPVRVEVAGPALTGTIEQLSAARGLVLRAGDGSERRIALEHVRAIERLRPPGATG